MKLDILLLGAQKIEITKEMTNTKAEEMKIAKSTRTKEKSATLQKKMIQMKMMMRWSMLQ